MHLTLVPYIAAAGELKTKPTQHSVKELRSIGIQPDVLLCRSEQPIARWRAPQDRAVHQRAGAAVISVIDVRQHLQDPIPLAAQQGWTSSWSTSSAAGQGRAGADLSEWDAVVEASTHPIDEVTIAVVGKYVDHQGRLQVGRRGAQARRHAPAHPGQPEVAGGRGGRARRRGVLAGVDGILVPGGFGDRGFEGKVLTVEARARLGCRTSASATACRRPWSILPATWPGWKAPTAPRTTAERRTR
jgi:CTP synthase